jgi:prevent-host-death family protein
MAQVSIRDLSRNASGVVAGVKESGRATLVTKHGRPVAALVPINPEDVEDFVLSRVPDYLEDLIAADAELTAGKTRQAADVFAELDARDGDR